MKAFLLEGSPDGYQKVDYLRSPTHQKDANNQRVPLLFCPRRLPPQAALVNSEPIALVEFTDGTTRPVYIDPDGRQWVPDDDGQGKVFGVWVLVEEADGCLVVEKAQ